MQNRLLYLLLLLLTAFAGYAQSNVAFADSIRKQYGIPELAYAIISSDSVFEMQVLGVKRVNTQLAANTNDKFRIGSNTKAVTGFIAALLVKQHTISWDTKFFDLFPELKKDSNKAYRNVTLLQLLSFRTKLFPYTYTYAEPHKGQFIGNETEQRYQFVTWFFKQKPVSKKDSICFSNLGYVAAGLMLEKASGKPYKQLVNELGDKLGINFGFGAPNSTDTAQPWGHNEDLKPEPPADDYKLNWLLAAGNINISLPDYVKFIQLQLQGLAGKSDLLTKQEFYFLHYGLTRFSVGWFQAVDNNSQVFSYNIGNPGTFLSKVYVYNDLNKAYIISANVQSPQADAGMDILLERLKAY